MGFETLTRSFASLVSLAMTEALIQFDNEHKNGIDHTKVRITFEVYKDALKRKLEQINEKKGVLLINHRLHQLADICVSYLLFIIVIFNSYPIIEICTS